MATLPFKPDDMAPDTSPPRRKIDPAEVPAQAVFLFESKEETDKRVANFNLRHARAKKAADSVNPSSRITAKGAVAKPSAPMASTNPEIAVSIGAAKKKKRLDAIGRKTTESESGSHLVTQAQVPSIKSIEAIESEHESDHESFKRPQPTRASSDIGRQFLAPSVDHIKAAASPDDYYERGFQSFHDIVALSTELDRVGLLIYKCLNDLNFLFSTFHSSLEAEWDYLSAMKGLLCSRERRKEEHAVDPELIRSYANRVQLVKKFEPLCSDIDKMSKAEKEAIRDAAVEQVKLCGIKLGQLSRQEKTAMKREEREKISDKITAMKKLKQSAQATRNVAIESLESKPGPSKKMLDVILERSK